MDPEYGRKYRELYERHWWWRAREAVIVDALRRHPPAGGWGHGNILDIGCGDGLFFDRLATFGESVQGVEPAAALVSDDPARRDRIFIGPFDERYQPGRSFRLIVMLDVLEHLDDPAGALRHALSLLDPDGVFLATVPAFRSIWTTHDDLNEHRTRYTKATMRALAAAGGLTIDRLEYFFHWTYPVKLAQRALETVTRPAPKPATVPPRPINAALQALSTAERAILAPLQLPFGSSLLVVGHRMASARTA
ncbi:MAG TPA: class I SAM-dependent methyltransferase [Gemmatimonadaceae bacterium]|nr:class I SAM-dependent methyltransferase [Gemmatimonadaceae bacterium]